MRFPIVAALVLCFLALPAAAQESPQAVLDHWVGNWTGGVAGGPSDSLRHMGATDHAEVKWVLDDKFLQGINLDASGNQVGIWMMRYDASSDSYQVIFFISSGSVSVWSGDWDEADAMMTWEAIDNDTGVVGSGTTRFVDGTQEWTLTYPRDGEEVTQSGMLRRQ